MYELDELFEILKSNKITKNKESVRRWLRQGKIVGTKGAGPKKNGWQVSEEALQHFLAERLPEKVELKPKVNATIVVLTEDQQEQLREEGRQEILKRLAANNIWEGRFVFKKKFIADCLDHKRIENPALRAYILNRMLEHKRGYATPGVVYLLDTFNFEGNRLAFHPDFEGQDEQIVFSLIKYLRSEYRDSTRRRGGIE